MSQENVEIIKAAMAAFSRGDWDVALSYAAPDAKFDTSRDLNETRGIYETHEGAKRALERFYEPWESWRVEIDEFVHVGEDMVVTRQTGYLRGRDGIEVTARTCAVWTFRDGAISEFTHYNSLDEALEAAGLSE
jgi:ketosteroid isomerase-like protein